MSNSIQERYRKAVASNLTPFHANWMPGQERALGDYGTFDGGIFVRKGNVRDHGLSFDVKTDPSKDDMSFCEGGSYTFAVDAGVSAAGIASGTATLTLTGNHSVFFQALATRTDEIADKTAFGKALIQAYQDETIEWEKPWVVITEILIAGRTIAAASTANSAKVVFKAKTEGPIPGTAISNANIGLDIQSTHDVGFHVCGESMQILLGLSKISGWWDSRFGPAKTLASELESDAVREELEWVTLDTKL